VPDLTVATFNVHCGVNGWGRPYDLAAACRLIDADVVVLQEAWSPSEGKGTAQTVGEALGYDVVSRPFAEGWLFQPGPDAPVRSSWGPKPWTRARAIRAIRRRARAGGGRAGPDGSAWPSGFQSGTWDLSILTRIPVARVDILDLGKLRLDPVRREAVALTVRPRGDGGSAVTVVGAHMSHVSDGSPLQFRRLSRLLPAGDLVVAGDMNMPGPPLRALLPGLRRVVRGRTWPAWRPVVQSDHIVASAGLAARAEGAVIDAASGSDHLPVRARFVVDG